MEVHCPNCRHSIPASMMDAQTDIAICPTCDEAYDLSELINNEAEEEPDTDTASQFQEAPPGAWFCTDRDSWQVGSTTRSAAAFIFVPLLVVLGGSLWGTYGTQIISGKADLLLSLIGLPLVAGMCFFGSFWVMAICGKVTVTVKNDEGRIFTGVGPIGRRWGFRWSGVRRVFDDYRQMSDGRSLLKMLQFEGETNLSFASMVSEPRRYFMLRVLRRMLRGQGS